MHVELHVAMGAIASLGRLNVQLIIHGHRSLNDNASFAALVFLLFLIFPAFFSVFLMDSES